MLGLDIYRELSENPRWLVYGVDKNHSTNIKDGFQYNGDLTDSKFLNNVLEQTNPDIIIHCAAIVNLNICENNRFLVDALHLDVTKQLSEYNSPSTKIIFISTDSVFDGRIGNYRETDTTNPLNYYAASKLAGERIVRSNDNHLIIRTNIFGFNLPLRESIAEWAIRSFMEGTAINGFTDISFNAIYTRHLASIINKMLVDELSGIIHVASANSMNKYEFLKYLELKILGNNKLVRQSTSENFKLYPPRPKNTILAIDKLRELLFPPTMEEGLNKLVNDYLEEYHEYN